MVREVFATMLRVTISLVYSAQPTAIGTVEGWYLPSTNTQAWFAALSETQASLHEFQYFLAPKSLADRHAQGLVAVRAQNSDRADPARTLTIPTGAISLHSFTDGPRNRSFLIPYYSYLKPSQADKQWLEEITHSKNLLYVWLPHCGLIGFECEDEIDLSLLLKRPQIGPVLDHHKWLAPPILSSIPDRITQIDFTETVTLSDFFLPMQQEIGGNTGDLLDMDESGNPSHGIRHTVRKTMRTMLKKILKQSPPDQNQTSEQSNSGISSNPTRSTNPRKPTGQPSAPIGLQFLFSMLGKSLQKEREQQIEKLLRLLSKDPDRALKFSIPVNSSQSGLGRGIAPPSSKLTSRLPDFSLNGLLGGGSPVDFWDISSEQRMRLMYAYREQAQRELAAGRIRRAAYIHAHLLADLDSAAKILESGKFYLEAAELFGKYLKRPRDQARCLVAAAQFSQAAAIYEEINDFVAAGDLLARIGETTKAVAAYQRAVEMSLLQRKILEAATLLDEKLNNRAEAYTLLWNQWPYGSQSMEATIRAFTWLNQEGRHEEALERLKTILNIGSSTNRIDLLKLLLHLNQNYTYAPLKVFTEDQCRLLAIADQSTASTIEITERLNILRQIHSNDVFLHRDLRRFIDRHRSKSTAKSKELKTDKRATLRNLAPLQLPALNILDALMLGNELLIFWDNNGSLRFNRHRIHDHGFDPGDSVQLMNFPNNVNPLVESYSNFAASPNTIFLNFFGFKFSLSDYTAAPKNSHSLLVKAPQNPNLIVGALSDSGTHWYLTREDFLLRGESKTFLSTFDIFQAIEPLVSNLGITPQSLFDNPSYIHLTTVNSIPYLAIGNILLAVHGSKLEVALISDTPITALKASLPHTLHRLLITTVNSLSVLYLSDKSQEYLSRSSYYSQAIFLQGGRIAALTEHGLELYERTQTSTVLRDSDSIRSSGTCRLLPLSIDTIGLLQENGTLHRWRHS